MLWTLLLVACAGAGLAVAAAVAKLLLFIFKCLKARQQFLSSPIPGPPLTSQLFGHIPNLMGPKGPWAFIKWTGTYGALYKLQFLDVFAVVLTDPDTIARITKKTGPGPYAPKPHFMYEALEVSTRPHMPNILSSEDGEYWKAVRQAAAPCFSMSSLKQVVPLVLELTQRAVERMAQHDSFDITDAAKRITSDVMGHLLYGEDLKGTLWQNSEYLQVLYPVLKAESTLFNNPFHLWQLWDPEVRLQRKCLAKHDAMMGDKIKRLRENPPAPHTMAAHILSAINPSTGKPLDDAHAKIEVATFMAAGFETTSHAITWCLTMLASCPDVQEQVFLELQQAGLAASGSVPGRDFSASDLSRLPLLSAVMREALRLCTPVPYGGSRYLTNEEGADMCGYHVPKGTIILMPQLAYSFGEHIYGPDAYQFKPERWMTTAAAPPTAAAAAAPTAAAAAGRSDSAPAGPGSPAASALPPDPITFMVGQRDCIGQNLAKLELQVVLATLLSRLRLSPGAELEQELQLAAATGQPVVKAVHALAGDYLTMQPLSGSMVLKLTSRA